MTCTGRNPWHVPPRTNCTRITVALAGSAGARSARECRPSAWMTTETRFHLPIGRSAAPGPGQAKRAETRLSREKRDAGSTVGNPRDRRPRRARIALQKLSADAGRDGGKANRHLMRRSSLQKVLAADFGAKSWNHPAPRPIPRPVGGEALAARRRQLLVPLRFFGGVRRRGWCVRGGWSGS